MEPENKPKEIAIKALAGSILLTAVVFLVALPAPRSNAFSFHISDNWYQTLAQIGSFYGGLFGPLVTGVGLYFIYYTYKTQVAEAGRGKTEAEIAQINKLYDDILEDIRSIRYRKRQQTLNTNNMGTLLEGIDAIHNYDGITNFGQDSLLNHVNLIVLSIKQLLDRITTSPQLQQEPKAREQLLDKTYLLAYTTIIWPVFEGIYKPHGKPLLLAYFGHVDTMFFYYEELTRRSMAWLTTKNLIRQEKPPGQEPGTEPKEATALPVQFYLAASIEEIRDAKRAERYKTVEEWLADLDPWLRANKPVQRPAQNQGQGEQSVLPAPTTTPLAWRDLAKHLGRAAIDKLPIPYEAKQTLLGRARKLWPLPLIGSATDATAAD